MSWLTPADVAATIARVSVCVAWAALAIIFIKKRKTLKDQPQAVYVVETWFNHEGSHLEGVYSTLCQAMECANPEPSAYHGQVITRWVVGGSGFGEEAASRVPCSVSEWGEWVKDSEEDQR